MVVADYFKTIEQLLGDSELIADKKVDFREFSSDEGMISGRLLFLGGYMLTFMEYIQIGKERRITHIKLVAGGDTVLFRFASLHFISY